MPANPAWLSARTNKILAGHLTHEFPTNQTQQALDRYHDVTVWSRAVFAKGL
jgi:hypothetical protein